MFSPHPKIIIFLENFLIKISLTRKSCTCMPVAFKKSFLFNKKQKNVKIFFENY